MPTPLKLDVAWADVSGVEDVRDIAGEIRLQFAEERVLRNAMLNISRIVREADPARQRAIVAADISKLMEPDVIRIYDAPAVGRLELVSRRDDLSVPPDALEMERELLARAGVDGKSRLSSHPQLDSGLAKLAKRCADQGLVTQVLPIAVENQVLGAFSLHWITNKRPGERRRIGFYSYFGLAQSVLASTREVERLERRLAELHQHAYVDKLTGLPSGLALDERLRDQPNEEPFSILSLDFDGMREANSELGYENGGDVLIRVVRQALAEMTHDPEFPARQHRGGDEFAVILPGASTAAAARRAAQIERALDQLPVPDTHSHIYKGASVGHATHLPDEEAGQTLGRAIDAMTQRKRERRRARAER